MLSIALVLFIYLFIYFTAVFSFDLNWKKFLVQSILLHETLIVVGCAEQLFTVFLPAKDVNIFHSFDLISLSFGLEVCC